jgi:hypothetical protein
MYLEQTQKWQLEQLRVSPDDEGGDACRPDVTNGARTVGGKRCGRVKMQVWCDLGFPCPFLHPRPNHASPRRQRRP